MTDRCLDPRELETIAGLDPDDPRRRHLETCVRCRGAARALAAFLEPGDTSDLEGLPAAAAELEARLAAGLDARRRAPARRRWPALALAAALAVCALGITTSEVLRGRRAASLPTGQRLRGDVAAAAVAVERAHGQLRLRWDGAPSADTMVYVFLDDGLTELGRRASDGVLVLPADDPLASTPFCQALAVAEGDTVGRSGISRLAGPRE
jgi:hypothetical protein